MNKSLLLRLLSLSFPDPVLEEFPGVSISPLDFGSDRVTLVRGDDLFITFKNKSFFDTALYDQIVPGKEVSARVPDPSCSYGYKDIRGVVVNVQPPLGHEWMRRAITSGNIPPILDETFLTFDFTCSLMSALGLKATVNRWFNFQTLKTHALPEGLDGLEGLEAFAGAPPVSCLVPIGDEGEEKVLVSAYEEIFDKIKAIQDALPDISPDFLSSLLPAGSFVECTATRSITQWRIFLLSQSDTMELAWLKNQMYHYFSDALGPLFVGCEVTADRWGVYSDK